MPKPVLYIEGEVSREESELEFVHDGARRFAPKALVDSANYE